MYHIILLLRLLLKGYLIFDMVKWKLELKQYRTGFGRHLDATSDGSWPCDGKIDIMEQWGNDYLTNNTTGATYWIMPIFSINTFLSKFWIIALMVLCR